MIKHILFVSIILSYMSGYSQSIDTIIIPIVVIEEPPSPEPINYSEIDEYLKNLRDNEKKLLEIIISNFPKNELWQRERITENIEGIINLNSNDGWLFFLKNLDLYGNTFRRNGAEVLNGTIHYPLQKSFFMSKNPTKANLLNYAIYSGFLEQELSKGQLYFFKQLMYYFPFYKDTMINHSSYLKSEIYNKIVDKIIGLTD